MRRAITTLALALLIGFLSYRAALATMPSDQMWTWSRQPFPCPGTVVDAHFDPVTGFLVQPTCTFSGGATQTDGSMYPPFWEAVPHWFRSAFFGLAVVPLAFIALWSLGRRRRRALQHRSEAVRGITTTLVLAMSLLGCAPTREPVKLMTLDQIGYAACCVPCVAGVLVPDEVIGTVIRVDKDGGGFSGCELHPTQGTRTEPVAWPAGHTGRRVGSEVEVLNGTGEVVATTGQRYECEQESTSKAYLCREAGAWDAWVEPPPQFDLAEVKAKFAQECENPTVLEDQTCDLIDMDGEWRASRDNLIVPMTSPKMNGVRGQRICEQIAAADLDVEPPGYEIVVLEARNGEHLGVCDVP